MGTDFGNPVENPAPDGCTGPSPARSLLPISVGQNFGKKSFRIISEFVIL